MAGLAARAGVASRATAVHRQLLPDPSGVAAAQRSAVQRARLVAEGSRPPRVTLASQGGTRGATAVQAHKPRDARALLQGPHRVVDGGGGGGGGGGRIRGGGGDHPLHLA